MKALLIIVWLVYGAGKPALTSISIIVPADVCHQAATSLSRASAEVKFASKTLTTCVPFDDAVSP